MMKPFEFYTHYRLPYLLGTSAPDVESFRKGIATVPADSIYYHTHRFIRLHLHLVPEPANDFAYWLRYTIVQNELAERIASINIISFSNLEELRKAFLEILDEFSENGFGKARAPEGLQFRFMSCRTFSFPLGVKVQTPAEFCTALEDLSVNTMFIHVFDSKLRHGRKRNDFAEWFANNGYPELADEMSNLDPYTMTLEKLRSNIIKLVKKYD